MNAPLNIAGSFLLAQLLIFKKISVLTLPGSLKMLYSWNKGEVWKDGMQYIYPDSN